jgi:hypothetical protein
MRKVKKGYYGGKLTRNWGTLIDLETFFTTVFAIIDDWHQEVITTVKPKRRRLARIYREALPLEVPQQ